MVNVFFPQEVEVFYILPALRRDIAKSLIKEGLSQREAAKIICVTPAAISQYVSSKRASDVKFNKAVSESINKSARTLKKNPDLLVSEISRLCRKIRTETNLLCRIHKAHGTLPANAGGRCSACK